MQKTIIFLILLSLMHVVTSALANATGYKPTIAIIISHEQNSEELNLKPSNLNLIYWSKQRYWPEGLRIKPVNLSSQHPIRMQFSQAILGSAPNEQVDYWNGQYFNGILPPYSVNSEEAVIRYVTQTKGAIGYVDACLVDDRVQALFWLTPNSNNLTTNQPKLDCVK